jgi:hypothetical protein
MSPPTLVATGAQPPRTCGSFRSWRGTCAPPRCQNARQLTPVFMCRSHSLLHSSAFWQCVKPTWFGDIARRGAVSVRSQDRTGQDHQWRPVVTRTHKHRSLGALHQVHRMESSAILQHGSTQFGVVTRCSAIRNMRWTCIQGQRAQLSE